MTALSELTTHSSSAHIVIRALVGGIAAIACGTFALADDRTFPGVLPTPKHYVELDEPLLLTRSGGRVHLSMPTSDAPLRSARTALTDALQALDVETMDENASVCIEVVVHSDNTGSAMNGDSAETLPPEGYTLEVIASPEGGLRSIAIRSSDSMGAYHSVQTLIQLLAKHDRGVTVRRAKIRDWPTYAFRSFKGQCWYYRDNLMLAEWAPRFKWNVFGPCYTDCPDWREPPDAYQEMIRQLCNQAGQDGVIRIMQLGNPYMLKHKAIRATSDSDIETLASFFELSLSHGSDVLMLCLDDFAYLPQEDSGRFKSLSAANAHIVSRFADRIHSSHPKARILLCPPPYWLTANRREGCESTHDYLPDLCARIPESIAIVWTGREVTTVCHQKSDVSAYQALIGKDRGLFLWDNTLKMPPGWGNVFRANAFLADCEELAGSAWPDLAKMVNGEAVINTYGPAEIYKIPLMTAADYLWNPEAYNPQDAMKRALYWFDENHEVGPMVHRWVNDLHQRLYDQRVAFLKAPSALGLAEFKSTLDMYQALFIEITSATTNANLIATLEPYRRRHVEVVGVLEAVLDAETLKPGSPAEGRDRLEMASRMLSQLTKELSKGDIAGQHHGCVLQVLEAANLKAIEQMLHPPGQ